MCISLFPCMSLTANLKLPISLNNRNLDLKNREISDLTGLENFTKIEELNLSGNRLTSESNLEVLNSFQLKKLDISLNLIQCFPVIHTSITEMNIGGNYYLQNLSLNNKSLLF